MRNRQTQIDHRSSAITARGGMPLSIEAQHHVAAIPYTGSEMYFFILVPAVLSRGSIEIRRAIQPERRTRGPMFEICRRKSCEPPGGQRMVRAQSILTVHIVKSIVFHHAGHLEKRADRILLGAFPMQTVRTKRHAKKLPLCFHARLVVRLISRLKSLSGIRIVGIVEHRECRPKTRFI